MTNHFRTTLMNLADVGDTDEHIAQGAARKSFNGVLTDVHLLLFPNQADREDILFRAYNYLQLVEASGFGHYVAEKDSRLTYELNQDFDFFYTNTFNLNELVARLNGRKAAIDRMFHDLQLGDNTPMNLWSRHDNPVMKVAGVVIGFVQRAG